MFAYCNNNPVNCIDPTGEKNIWFQLFEDHQYGFIHIAVQLHILSIANAERIVLGKEAVIPGVGRADIIDLNTREIWEIKHGGRSPDMQLQRKDEAWDQLKKYLKADKNLKPGRAHRFSGTFTINDGDTSYMVIYWTPNPGVILYSVHALKEYSTSPYKVYAPAHAVIEQKNKAEYFLFAFIPIMEPVTEKIYA